MKKISLIVLSVFVLGVCLTACGSSDAAEDTVKPVTNASKGDDSKPTSEGTGAGQPPSTANVSND